MPIVQSIFDMSWQLTSAAAVVVAGAIAFVAHERATRFKRQLDSAPELAERDRIAEELETKRRQLSELEIAASQTRGLQAQEAEIRARLASLEQQEQSIGSSLRSLADSEHQRRAELARVQAEIDDLGERRRSLEQALEDRGREERELSMQIVESRTALSAIEARGRDLSSQIETSERAYQDVQQRLQSLNGDVIDAQSRLAAAQVAKEELDRAIEELREQRSQLVTAVRQAERDESKRENLAAELQHLESKRAELGQRVVIEEEKLGAASRQIEKLLVEQVGRENELRQIRDRINEGRATLGEGSRPHAGGEAVTIEAYRARVASLWEGELLKEAAADHADSEETALERVVNHLKNSGLVFHERVVHQFHTALKVANEAPLLVLAGISGTGKSLLPQRYAEAMGINRLVIPVQPRWDGPQDLLGFFNHLEQKYVATPLSRALAQMHQFPDDHRELQPNDAAERSLADQMLLVLLDEMNLARVEFYFSEFLSRLETRRTLPADAALFDRRLASITIECGSVPDGVEPVRLLPGSNVLFVGTMNEDETTQSLSDKVVDRANIMKFGMPRHMEFGAAGGAAIPTRRLLHSTWKQWINHENQDGEELHRVRQFCNQTNSVLEPLGRAFGHRLLKAVSAYVRQYPSHVPNRVNRALSDQIEMRILPRVRGVSLDHGMEALDKIAALAGGYEDEQLADAINEARNSEMASRDDRFHWSGLSRTSEAEQLP